MFTHRIRHFGWPMLVSALSGMPTVALPADLASGADAEQPATISLEEPAPAPIPAQPRSSSRLVEEIVVTAQKREEAIQDVPVAVTAFSDEQLSVLGIESTKDLSRVTPGLQLTEFAGFTLVYLRGVGTDSFLPYSDPSVATYVDGLYVPAQQGLVNSFGGVERVEVLKGPQGTLFGRNSTGGAINVITKSPGPAFEASMQSEIGNLHTFKNQVFTSFPLLDHLAMSVSGIYNTMNPYYDQIVSTAVEEPFSATPVDDLSDERSTGARVKLRWYPLDELDFTLAAYRIKQKGPGSTISALKKPSALATLLGIDAEAADYEIHRNEPSAFNIRNTAIYGNSNWSLPWFDVKLIGGHQEIYTYNAYYDFDQSQKALVSFGTQNAYSKVDTAELQITSNDSSWLSDRLKWIAGAYYLRSAGGYDPIYLRVAGDIPQPGAALLPTEVLDQVLADVPILAPSFTGIELDIHGVLETHSLSGFLQGTYDFNDWLALTLGGRYQTEDRFLTKQYVSDPKTDIRLISYNAPKVEQSNFSPKVSFDLRPMDDVLIYLSWTKGYKSGTYNGINIYIPPTYVQPEIVNSYELGTKTEWFGGLLRLNGAIFQSTVDQMQVTFVSLTNGGAITFENAGEGRVRGAELESLVVPMPDSNPGLVISGGVSYLDSVFTDYENGSGFDDTTGLFRNRAYDFTGNRVPRSPEWSGNLVISQTIDVSSGSIEIGGDVYFNGGFYYTAQNSEFARQKKYSLLNARVSYLHEPWNLRVTVFGQNLDDETYSLAQFTADFGTADTLAPPRTYGVRLNWDFQ